MIGKFKEQKSRTWLRQCERCNELFNSTAQRGKYCEDCKKTTKNYSKYRNKEQFK